MEAGAETEAGAEMEAGAVSVTEAVADAVAELNLPADQLVHARLELRLPLEVLHRRADADAEHGGEQQPAEHRRDGDEHHRQPPVGALRGGGLVEERPVLPRAELLDGELGQVEARAPPLQLLQPSEVGGDGGPVGGDGGDGLLRRGGQLRWRDHVLQEGVCHEDSCSRRVSMACM